MNKHEEAVRRALEDFCREYTGRDAGWRIETWLHPVTRSVESAVVMPEFAGLGITGRITLIDDYLWTHLPKEHYVNLSLKLGLTPEEYEETDWMPDEAEVSLAAR